jgi:hypothetical protein
MKDSIAKYLRRDFNRLRAFTEECRDDMHEPDEQDISADVFGHTLDNACGDDFTSGEFVVKLRNDHTEEWDFFNLATLIAIARQAQFPIEGE